MKRRPSRAVEKAAYMASEGRKQTDIATRLNVTPVTVTRLIKEAEKRGILVIRKPELRLDAQTKQDVERELYGSHDLENRLRKLSGDVFVKLAVSHDGPSESALEGVAAIAARYLVNDVLRSGNYDNVGVTWGGSNREIVKQIEQQLDSVGLPDPRKAPNLIQVSGDPEGAVAEPTRRSSTLVSKLHSLLKQTANNRFTFSVSSSIPRGLKPEQEKAIRAFIRRSGGYASIFDSTAVGKPARLKLKLDALVTSCGNGKPGQDRWLEECAKSEEMAQKDLEALTVGNIGGCWLPKATLNRSERKELEGINSRWIGIGIRDIRAIAKRGGVVLVAAESHKAETIIHLVKAQLVSTLFVSSELATALTERLPDSTEPDASKTRKGGARRRTS